MARTHKVSPHTGWFCAGNITSEEAALDVDERDVTTAEALTSTKTVIITPPGSPTGMLFRFRADGSADVDSKLELYAARGKNDYYLRLATLTITTGTQDTATSTIHFIDKIVATNEETLFDGEEGAGTSNADYIDHYYIRTFGFDRFLFVCSDLDSTTVYVDCCYLYE